MKSYLLNSVATFAPVDSDRGSEPASQRPRARAAHPQQREDRRTGIRQQRPVARRHDDGGDDDDDHQRREAEKRQRQARRQKRREQISTNPLRLYRPALLCELLSIDPSTLWRWRRDRLIEEPVTIAGVTGWTHQQIAKLLKADES